jgi:hypothetical protein
MRIINLALAVIFAATSAFAQAPAPTDIVQGTVVDLHPFWTAFQPILETVVGAAVTAILGWVAVRVQQWTGHAIEQKHMDALDASIKTGLGQILAQVDAKSMTVDVKQQAIVNAIGWAERSTPDALKYFGLDDPAKREKLGDLVQGKLGQLLAQAAPVTTVDNTIGGK